MNAIDILKERGFLAQCTDEAGLRELLGQEQVSFYTGFDPTADSLHAGHLIALMAMSHLQRAGHRPICLVGGGTGTVGDPSGRTDMRKMMTDEIIRHNCDCFRRQISRFIDFTDDRAIMVDNGDWLRKLNYIDLLRDIGAHFTVNRMLAAESYKQRWEKGLTFLEFNYMIMQAYDFMELNGRYNCKLEMGGDDQWSNIIAGVGYSIGIEGNNVLCIQAKDAAIIADLMMGNDGTNPDQELSELHMSAVSECMNQMMGSVATSLSSMFNKKVDITPPVVTLVDLATEEVVSKLLDKVDPIIQASFRMEVDGLIDSEIMQLLPVDVAKEMVDALMNQQPDVDNEEEAVAAATAPPPAAAPAAPAEPAAAAPANYGYGAPPMQPHVASNVPVQSAQFTPLSSTPVQVNDANIGLILDVPLQVNVELGRTKKSIKDILDLTKGSIVELDKLAGEPVDIMVNGKYLAKGEVVVIDENFGVRITEIVSPLERAARLQ